ncbi:uncharacterized protein LOC135215925 [Macrobrachium nipponense]|uniref:uncharacterized protein LOC135215925 n=1 Tax=Macrobrachium nipponense TaxID=159736 RepID=UPI0030C8264B
MWRASPPILGHVVDPTHLSHDPWKPCPPFQAPVAGSARLSRHPWQAQAPPIPARMGGPTRPSQHPWWAPPAHTRTPMGDPLPLSQGMWRASPALPRTHPRPPQNMWRASTARTGTRGGSRPAHPDPWPAYPPVLAPMVSPSHLSQDTWQASPALPGTTCPPTPETCGGAHLTSPDTWLASPTHPATAPMAGNHPPIPAPGTDPTHPSRHPW